jgi:plasmid replication initiation protein
LNEPKKWSLQNDPYVRKSEDLARSEVHYADNVKMSGTVERLSQTLLKAVQDRFFDMAKQEKFQELHSVKSLELSEQYKEAYIGARLKKEKRQGRLPIGGTAADSPLEIAEKSYMGRKEELDRLASKEAWRIVLQDNIKDDELRLKFYAQDILKVALVSDANTTRLYQDVMKVQKKFNKWAERIFDVKTGTFAERTINATLFPVSTMIQRGSGHLNEIEVKVEKDLTHAILFLNKNFLGYHLQIYVELKEPNPQKTYELLIESLSPRGIKNPDELDDIQKRFGTNYDSNADFLAKVIAPSVKKINKALGTKIELKRIKEGRKVRWVRFIVNEQDEKILRGEKVISDFIDPSERETFGYYIALLEYHKGEVERGDLYDRSIELNSSDELSEYQEHYQDYMENLDDYERLMLLNERCKTPEGFVLDMELMILADDKGRPLATTASGCLEELQAFSETKESNQTSLPGMETATRSSKTYMDFLPFRFKLTASKSELMNSENVNDYAKRIEIAIKMGDHTLFEFEDEKKEREFARDILRKSIDIVDADVIPSEKPTHEFEHVEPLDETYDDISEAANLMLKFFKAINPKSRATLENCSAAAEEIIADTGGLNYTKEDIRAVTEFLMSKEGDFWRTVMISPKAFSRNFSKAYDKMAVSSFVPKHNLNATPDYNILDAMKHIKD